MAKVDRSWTVGFASDSVEDFIRTFHSSSLRVFTATNYPRVERLKRTKIQVCISMLFNGYNVTLNDLGLSSLNIFFLTALVTSLYTDVFSLILRHWITI